MDVANSVSAYRSGLGAAMADEVTYPYAYVAWVRKLAHYAGQDCDECPGAKRCCAVYAARCHYGKGFDVSQEIFPCGLSPEKGMTAEEVLEACHESHPHRKEAGQRCAGCGKPIKDSHRLCHVCRKRRERERANAGDATQAEEGS